MMRKYKQILDKLIKEADPESWVTVKVAHVDAIQTIINGLQKEKSMHNVTRKRLDLPAYGKLVIHRDTKNLKVSFKLTNSGAAL
jgi:hypothetical protein